MFMFAVCKMDGLVDNLIEDEVEKAGLLAKPTCFIVVGKPVNTHSISKNEFIFKKLQNVNGIIMLLQMLSEGRSIPDDLVLKLIHAKLNSPDLEHYGYVLSCLPFMSEGCLKIPEQIEQIKNLKLAPDVIINIKCADEDLVQRLSGLKQHPETGQLFTRDQWAYEDVYNKKEEDGDQNSEIVYFMIYMLALPLSCNNLMQFQEYMADHNPLYLLELDGNNTAEELVLLKSLHQEDVLRNLSSRSVVPGFKWRRSRWGQTCPVALKEGKVIHGKAEFSVGFHDKLYILSSQEAYQKFIMNPRRYLLPPMPRIPCKVSIVGPSQSGKSTVCKLLAQRCGATVLDVEQMMQPVLQERLDKIKDETTTAAIDKVQKKSELHSDQNTEVDSDVDNSKGWVLDNFPKNLSQMEALQRAGIMPGVVFCLRDTDGHNGKRHRGNVLLSNCWHFCIRILHFGFFIAHCLLYV
uniref:(d)CMP kinase n=1 Tax=Salarias fasciatus TaxID=181472 RepID=A0A672GWK8_SALFA